MNRMNVSNWIEYAAFGLLLPLIFTVGFIVFIWGAFQYFIAGGPDEEAREKGKSLMVYGIILFVIMLLLYTFFASIRSSVA